MSAKKPKAKAGKKKARTPYKFTPAKREEYLRLLREDGLGRCAAARAIGMAPQSVKAYCNDHPDFAAERDQAELEANEQVENALWQAALSGNVTACQVWLYNRMADRWADRRHTESPKAEGTSALDQWIEHMKGEA